MNPMRKNNFGEIRAKLKTKEDWDNEYEKGFKSSRDQNGNIKQKNGIIIPTKLVLNQNNNNNNNNPNNNFISNREHKENKPIVEQPNQRDNQQNNPAPMVRNQFKPPSRINANNNQNDNNNYNNNYNYNNIGSYNNNGNTSKNNVVRLIENENNNDQIDNDISISKINITYYRL